jgi:hypothetical protein
MRINEIIMTLYIARAKPKNDLSDYEELELGKISKLRPFGESLHHGLENSRFDNITGYAMWVEEDYCSFSNGKRECVRQIFHRYYCRASWF